MPRKQETKSSKRRTQVKDLSENGRELSKREQKKVKGGLLPYIEQDNVQHKPINVQDGTSNTLTIK
jgi:hypothetical protein